MPMAAGGVTAAGHCHVLLLQLIEPAESRRPSLSSTSGRLWSVDEQGRHADIKSSSAPQSKSRNKKPL